MLKFSLMAVIFVLSFKAFSKQFSNGYIEFELPPQWECVIEGSEWVCQASDADRKKEAIIILAAKKRGPQDNLAEYQAYLKQPKTYQLPGAKMQRSEPKSVSTMNINGQQWIDALHLASEVPGFYTRYLAAVKSDIGVAITFSVTKSLYNAYKGVFDNVIKSMRIFERANLANTAAGLRNNQGVGDDEVTIVGGDEIPGIAVDGAKVKKRDGGGGENDLLIFIVIGAVAAFALMKLKKGKGKTKKKKKKAS